MFSDFMRCGFDSAQCIRRTDKCNGIRDCVNSWDELPTTCSDDVDGNLRYVSPCKNMSKPSKPSHLLAIRYRTSCKHSTFLVEFFSLLVQPSDRLTLVLRNGSKIFLDNDLCPCNVSYDPTCVLAVHAQAVFKKGFKM